MSLADLVAHATDKERFHTLENYIAFCSKYLEFVETGLQARIVSRNKIHYQFFQYRQDGSFNISRRLNSLLMYDAESFSMEASRFIQTLQQLKDGEQPSDGLRENIIRSMYTIQ
jgi:hypothetical protein